MSKIFLREEGIDIEPAAAVATASPMKCVEDGTVERAMLSSCSSSREAAASVSNPNTTR
ncbi:MAG: hypothetical protein SH857_04110 [Chitinophagales bacterium]|nr:hypothetical protein [Chitinophagales bacterium]